MTGTRNFKAPRVKAEGVEVNANRTEVKAEGAKAERTEVKTDTAATRAPVQAETLQAAETSLLRAAQEAAQEVPAAAVVPLRPGAR